MVQSRCCWAVNSSQGGLATSRLEADGIASVVIGKLETGRLFKGLNSRLGSGSRDFALLLPVRSFSRGGGAPTTFGGVVAGLRVELVMGDESRRGLQLTRHFQMHPP